MPIDPAALRFDCRFAISVDDDFEAELLQTLREVREAKFGSAVIRRRNCNKWWRNQSAFQLLDPNIRWPADAQHACDEGPIPTVAVPVQKRICDAKVLVEQRQRRWSAQARR